MRHELLDQLRWHLRLGEPGPVERAAVAIAAGELREAEVDLPMWRQAADGARDDAHARERYVQARVAQLRRELRVGSRPLLAADREDREERSAELRRRAEAYRATPEGQEAYRAALAVALRGTWTFSLLYYAVVFLILLFGLWLASA